MAGRDDVDVDEPVDPPRRPRRRRAASSRSASREHEGLRARVERAAHELWLGRRRDRQHAGRGGQRARAFATEESGDVASRTRGRRIDHECSSGPSTPLSGSSRRPTGDHGRVITDCRSQRPRAEAVGSRSAVEVPCRPPHRSIHPMVSCPGCPGYNAWHKRVFDVEILIFHGYLLRGTGSNVYNAQLAAAMSSLGARGHLFCQDRRPTRSTSSTPWDWDSGALSVVRCESPFAHDVPPADRPAAAGLRRGPLRGIRREAVRRLHGRRDRGLPRAQRDGGPRGRATAPSPVVALANHLVMGPVILARALRRRARTRRRSTAARSSTPSSPTWSVSCRTRARASRVRAGSWWARGTRPRACGRAMDDPSLPTRTRLGPPGVDVAPVPPRDRRRRRRPPCATLARDLARAPAEVAAEGDGSRATTLLPPPRSPGCARATTGSSRSSAS